MLAKFGPYTRGRTRPDLGRFQDTRWHVSFCRARPDLCVEIRPKLGRCSAEFGRCRAPCWPNFMDPRASLAELVPVLCRGVGSTNPSRRPNLAEIGPILDEHIELGPKLADAQVRPNSSRILLEIGPKSADIGQIWPTSAGIGRLSAKFGQAQWANSAETSRALATSASLAESGRILADNNRNQANIRLSWSNMAHIWSTFARISPRCGRDRQHSLQFGSNLANIGQD